jgi:hypothetical protein
VLSAVFREVRPGLVKTADCFPLIQNDVTNLEFYLAIAFLIIFFLLVPFLRLISYKNFD